MKRFILLVAVTIVATTNVCLAQGGLNEVRFRDWSDEQWLDNDYIREFRNYIEEFQRGDIEDEVLEAHKDIIDSQFCVEDIDASIWGGADIYVVFLDDPSMVFYVQVYGDVDEDKVVDYEVRQVVCTDDSCTLTKEKILKFVKENPMHKLW
ncbi:MAG: hypothetical protein J6U93_01820 [Alistipes sp.]|nr:hypothetical protein [Alistipes sp.]